MSHSVLSKPLISLTRKSVPESGSVIFDGLRICYFEGSQTLFRINGKSYTASCGDVLVLAPNMILEYESVTEDFVALELNAPISLVMELPSPFDTDIISAARRIPLIRFWPQELEVLVELLACLGKILANNSGIYAEEIAKSLVFAIIYKIGECYSRLMVEMPDHAMLNDERLSDEFFRLLALHFRSHRTVKFYADQMALTPKYLSQAIKQITGKTVHEWVDDAIVLEIKNLLRTTDRSIQQISDDLSFCSPSAFVQYFKQHVGSTPLAYRRSEDWS